MNSNLRYTKIRFLLALIAFFLVAGCGGDTDAGDRRPVQIKDGEAPDFTAMTMAGDTIKLSDYRGKKAVIVDIWATWCGPCRMAMPELQKLYEKYPDKLEIIAASTDDAGKKDEINKFVKELGLTFKIVHDTDQAISRNFPTRGIPHTILISKEGTIVKKFTGFDSGFEAKAEKLLSL